MATAAYKIRSSMGFSRREIWAMVITAAILFALAATLPAPVKEIDGVRTVVINGFAVPRWLGIIVLLVALMVVYSLVSRILRRFESKEETFRYSEIYEGPDGGFVAWQPEIPGTASPMDYAPPKFTDKTTAWEFLTTEPPNAMRALILEEDSFKELMEFHELQSNWLDIAPEATLRDLLPTGEEWVLKGSEDTALLLRRAHEQRGIPTADELDALAQRCTDDEVRRALLGSTRS